MDLCTRIRVSILFPRGLTSPNSATRRIVITPSSGSSAKASASLNAGVLTVDFGIPQGIAGAVSNAQLSNDLVNTQNATVNIVLPLASANSNAIKLLSMTVNDPTRNDVQIIATRIRELINALRR